MIERLEEYWFCFWRARTAAKKANEMAIWREMVVMLTWLMTPYFWKMANRMN